MGVRERFFHISQSAHFLTGVRESFHWEAVEA
jgi:hypothetical protein